MCDKSVSFLKSGYMCSYSMIIFVFMYVGFTSFSILSLYCYFWFLYTLHLFLRVTFPIKMVRLHRSKYRRKVHAFEIALVVLLGTVPYIVFAAKSEFHIVNFPPLYCGASPRYNFYGTIVPTVLASCVTFIMMLFVLYHIHTVSY